MGIKAKVATAAKGFPQAIAVAVSLLADSSGAPQPAPHARAITTAIPRARSGPNDDLSGICRAIHGGSVTLDRAPATLSRLPNA